MRAHPQTSAAPYVGITIGVLATSTGAIFIRLAQSEGAPSVVIAAYRLSLAALLLAPLVLWRGRTELRAMTRRRWVLALASGVALGLHFGAWISSLAYTSVASSVVLVSTSPLFVAVLSAALLRERLPRLVLAGLLVALAGAVVVALADACQPAGCPPWQAWVRGPAFLGDALALLGAVGGAVYFTAGRALRPTLSLLTYVFVTYGTAALCLAGAAVVLDLPLTGYSPAAYGWFILLALIPQLVGHSALNWALKFLPATYVSLTVLGEPAASTLLAALFLGEQPTLVKVLGGVLILAGIVLASRRTA